MKDFESAMDGLAAIALAVYLAMVLARGNLKPFLAQVVKETGFVEFIVALWVLSLILKVPEVRPLAVPLATMAAIILAMRITAGADIGAFKAFASGQAGLFETVGRVFGNQN